VEFADHIVIVLLPPAEFRHQAPMTMRSQRPASVNVRTTMGVPGVTASALDATVEAAASSSEGASSDRFWRAWEGRFPGQSDRPADAQRLGSGGVFFDPATKGVPGYPHGAADPDHGEGPRAHELVGPGPPQLQLRLDVANGQQHRGTGGGGLGVVYPLRERLGKRRGRDTRRALGLLTRVGVAPQRCLRRGRTRAAPRKLRLTWGWHQQVLEEPAFGDMSLAGIR